MTQTKFEQAIEIINQAVFELLPIEDSTNTESRQSVNDLLCLADEGYVLVQWPGSQDLMEEEWFEEEAILALGSEDRTGSSAYFVPIKRIL